MPPKTNQFKQGQQPPPKKSATPAASSAATAAAAATKSDGVCAPVDYRPMHLLLRSAASVSLQTLIPSASAPAPAAGAAPAPAAGAGAGAAPSSSSMRLAGPPVALLRGTDCSECDALMTRDGSVAIIATATDVRIVFVGAALAAAEEGASSSSSSSVSAPSSSAPIDYVVLAEEKICHMALSPLETFLVVYRMRDAKRPTAGNMSVYNLAAIVDSYRNSVAEKKNQTPSSVATGLAVAAAPALPTPAPSMSCVQGAWPALVWTANEEYCIRHARGLLLLHEGAIGGDDDDDEDSANGPRCKIELQLPQNKEPVFETPPIILDPSVVTPHSDKIPALEQAAKALPPLFALFKPHNKNQLATLGFYRLPMFREPMYQIQLQRAEGAQLEWNRTATHLCVITKQEPERGDNSYYAKTTLMLVNIRDRKEIAIKFPGVATIGAGATYEAVHDVKWCGPRGDEFIVIHGTMPRNKATLYNDKGQALYQFGEAPRNLSMWAPNGAMFVIGGTGSLVGEFQFYDREGLDQKKPAATPVQRTITGRPVSAAASSSSAADVGGKLGSFNEKSSEQTWSPDSRFVLCATIFGKLRIDNKYFVYKHNGERCCEVKFPTEEGSLHQALWVPRPSGFYGGPRAPSPTLAAATAPKPALFKARGAGNAAISAALSRAPAPAGAVAARPAGLLPGENPVQQKPKKR